MLVVQCAGDADDGSTKEALVDKHLAARGRSGASTLASCVHLWQAAGYCGCWRTGFYKHNGVTLCEAPPHVSGGPIGCSYTPHG
jgi:hypothetical protein